MKLCKHTIKISYIKTKSNKYSKHPFLIVLLYLIYTLIYLIYIIFAYTYAFEFLTCLVSVWWKYYIMVNCCLFFRRRSQWLHIGGLKSAAVGVFIPHTRACAASLHTRAHFLSDVVLSVWPEGGPQLLNESDPLRRSRNSLSQSLFLWTHTFPGAEAKEIVMSYRAFLIPIFWSVDCKWD